MSPAIAAAFAKKYSYFNTFGGNPVSAAVGNAVHAGDHDLAFSGVFLRSDSPLSAMR